ncbi:MAG: proprotein convertase P-domain-containing protein [Geminicoccaceae bacterium]
MRPRSAANRRFERLSTKAPGSAGGYLLQADGERDLERGINLGNLGDLYRQGSQTSFGDATNPNSRWWDGALSGLELSNIGAAGAAIAYTVPDANVGGGTQVTVSSAPGLAIPDNSFAGVADMVEVSQAGTVETIEVTIDITHTYRGDLVVRLRAPSGVAVILHDRAGGGQNDLKETYIPGGTASLALMLGEQMEGPWRLEVSDHAAVDTGVLNSWSMTLGATSSPVEIAESPGVVIPDNNPSGIVRTLTAVGVGNVGMLTIDLDITHSYIADLVVQIVSPQGDRVMLHNRQGGSSDNIIRSFSEVTTPELVAFTDRPIAGDWRLEVSDQAGLDIGKLNRWAVRFQSPAIT